MPISDQADALPNGLPDDPLFLKELIGRQREVIITYAAYTALLKEQISELSQKVENIENKRSDN